MLTWKTNPKDKFESSRRVDVCWGDTILCSLDTWGFASCAVHNLFKFNAGGFSSSKTTADKLFAFILKKSEGLSYQPKTMYFLLSSSQLGKPELKSLTVHPKVKQVDCFINQAHGPNKVFLYRYSDVEDFK